MTSIPAETIQRILQRELPEVADGSWQIHDCRLSSVRKHRRKRFFEYVVRWRNGDGADQALRVLAKSYGSDRGGRAMAAMRWLQDRGFSPPAPHRVPRPLAHDPNLGLLLQTVADGLDVASALGEDATQLESYARAAARWLAALHGIPGEALLAGPPDHVGAVRRFAGELSAAFPVTASRLRALAGRLQNRLEPCSREAIRPAHGDYHPKNIFVADGWVTVVDFDTFGQQEHTADAGYFLGQMAIMAYFRHGDSAVAAPAIRGLLDEYSASGQPFAWERLSAHVSRTFLQSLHFELCTLRNDKMRIIEPWLTWCEQWLESSGPQDIDRLLLSASGEGRQR